MFELVIKKSRFVAISYDIKNKEDVKNIIDKLKTEHKDARHICYAYITESSAGMSDDGEPQGTAGKPIYNLLNMKQAKNKLVVVIRYFGGTKLGAGGLIRAYVGAAKEVI